MRVLYTLIVAFAKIVLPIVGLFNPKIKQFLNQRKTTFQTLSNWKSSQSEKPVLWLHCASLGEYEMIVPLISEKSIQAKFEIVVSFFSASGYNHAKTEGLIACKFYLPIDSHSNMKRLVSLVNPTVFVLVKYDFWLNLLSAVNNHDCSNILVNGVFRKKQFITSVTAGPWRKQLKKFAKIFVQNERSQNQLKKFNFENVQLSNDLRYDRVVQLKSHNHSIPEVEQFTNQEPTLILGSSWPEEEYIVLQYLIAIKPTIKVIIAPHDISDVHIQKLKNDFSAFDPVLFTDVSDASNHQVFILNTIGHLSSAYQYASMAFIGGAYGKGLHNVLEAAVHGLPIFTGSEIERFPEALSLQKLGVLHALDKDPRHFIEVIADHTDSPDKRIQAKTILSNWFENQTGQTKVIAEYILSVSA